MPRPKSPKAFRATFLISGSSPNGSPRTHQRLQTSTAPGSQARKDKAEFERSLHYSAEIGAVFKSRVQISADGFFWKDQKFKLEDVTRLRWGGTKHSVNGIPTGTTYDILVATPHASASLNFRGEAIFTAQVDRLWRGVGVRLLYSYAEYLKKGGRLTFPGAVIEDEAMAKVLEADNAHPLFS